MGFNCLSACRLALKFDRHITFNLCATTFLFQFHPPSPCLPKSLKVLLLLNSHPQFTQSIDTVYSPFLSFRYQTDCALPHKTVQIHLKCQPVSYTPCLRPFVLCNVERNKFLLGGGLLQILSTHEMEFYCVPVLIESG